MRRRQVLNNVDVLVVSLIYFLLAVAWSYPLITYMGSALPVNASAKGSYVGSMQPSDSLNLYYYLWHFKQTLSMGVLPLYDHYEFAGTPFFLGFHEWPLAAAFWALSVGGTIFAYNMIVLLSFPLTGVATYVLSRLYKVTRLSAFVAGTIFSLAPFRIIQLFGGHPNGFVIFLLPGTLYFVEKSLRSKRRAMYSVAAAVSLLVLVLTEPMQAYFTLLVVWGGVVVDMISHLHSQKNVEMLRRYAVLVPLVFASVGAFLYARLLSESWGQPSRSLEDAAQYSPPMINLFTKYVRGTELVVYLGISVLFIALLPVLWQGIAAQVRRQGALFYFSLLVLGTLASLGASFPLFPIAWRLLPFMTAVRTPTRLIYTSFLSLSILSAFSLDQIQKAISRVLPRTSTTKIKRIQLGRRFLALCVVAIALTAVLTDYHWGGVAMSSYDEANPVYRLLASDRGNYTVLGLPLLSGPDWHNSVYELIITMTQIRMVNGYSPFPPASFEQTYRSLETMNRGEINAAQYSLLTSLQVKYVIVLQGLFQYVPRSIAINQTVYNLRHSRYLGLVLAHGGVWLFKVANASNESNESNRSKYVLNAFAGGLSPLTKLGLMVNRTFASSDYSNSADAQEPQPNQSILASIDTGFSGPSCSFKMTTSSSWCGSFLGGFGEITQRWLGH